MSQLTSWAVHPNEAIIERFYGALQRRDVATMAACYDPAVHYSDPVFGDLHGPEATAMWEMLCQGGEDLEVDYRNIVADDTSGSAHWDAHYTFGKDNRPIHNSIDARFEFSNGLITRHEDVFDLWRWTRMALGLRGALTGWSQATQRRVQQGAARSLRRFIESTDDTG